LNKTIISSSTDFVGFQNISPFHKKPTTLNRHIREEKRREDDRFCPEIANTLTFKHSF